MGAPPCCPCHMMCRVFPMSRSRGVREILVPWFGLSPSSISPLLVDAYLILFTQTRSVPCFLSPSLYTGVGLFFEKERARRGDPVRRRRQKRGFRRTSQSGEEGESQADPHHNEASVVVDKANPWPPDRPWIRETPLRFDCVPPVSRNKTFQFTFISRRTPRIFFLA